MPFLAPIVAFLAANAPAITAASAVAGAGTSIGEAIANSGGGSKPPVAPVTPPPNAQQLLQQRQAVSAQDSNLQEAGSGDLGANFLAQIAPNLAGISGQPGANAAGSFGANQNWTPANSQPINAAVQGQPFNLSDFINSNT